MLQTQYQKVRFMGRPMKESATAGPFGRWLRESRTTRGLTMEALAEIADISQVAISNLERGNRNASRDMVERLARALSPEYADSHTARALLNAGLKSAGFAAEGEQDYLETIVAEAGYDSEGLDDHQRQELRTALDRAVIGVMEQQKRERQKG